MQNEGEKRLMEAHVNLGSDTFWSVVRFTLIQFHKMIAFPGDTRQLIELQESYQNNKEDYKEFIFRIKEYLVNLLFYGEVNKLSSMLESIGYSTVVCTEVSNNLKLLYVIMKQVFSVLRKIN